MQWGICQALLQERGLQCGRGELRVLRQGSEGTTRARNTWVQCVRLQWITNYLSFVLSPAKKKSLIQQPTNMLSFLVGSSALILEHNTAVYRKQQCTLSSVFTLVILFGKQGFRLLAVVGGSFQSERWALFNAERMVVHWNTPFFVLIAAHLSGIRGGGYHGCILFLHTNLTCL